MYEEITAQARQAVTELVDAAGLRAGELLVVGCSSSEMVGARIGEAPIICARTRPRFIGGERARYQDELR